jgi:hypothetical protein
MRQSRLDCFAVARNDGRLVIVYRVVDDVRDMAHHSAWVLHSNIIFSSRGMMCRGI